MLAIDSRVACPRCAEGKGCGAGLFNGGRRQELQVDVPGDLVLSDGDTVTLSLSDSSILRAAIIAYGIPLTGVIVSLSCAWLWFGALSDGAGAGIAAAGLLAGWVWGRKRLASPACRRELLPRLTAESSNRRG